MKAIIPISEISTISTVGTTTEISTNAMLARAVMDATNLNNQKKEMIKENNGPMDNLQLKGMTNEWDVMITKWSSVVTKITGAVSRILSGQ